MEINRGLVILTIGLCIFLGAAMRGYVFGFYTQTEMLIWLAIVVIGLGIAVLGSKMMRR